MGDGFKLQGAAREGHGSVGGSHQSEGRRRKGMEAHHEQRAIGIRGRVAVRVRETGRIEDQGVGLPERERCIRAEGQQETVRPERLTPGHRSAHRIHQGKRCRAHTGGIQGLVEASLQPDIQRNAGAAVSGGQCQQPRPGRHVQAIRDAVPVAVGVQGIGPCDEFRRIREAIPVAVGREGVRSQHQFLGVAETVAVAVVACRDKRKYHRLGARHRTLRARSLRIEAKFRRRAKLGQQRERVPRRGNREGCLGVRRDPRPICQEVDADHLQPRAGLGGELEGLPLHHASAVRRRRDPQSSGAEFVGIREIFRRIHGAARTLHRSARRVAKDIADLPQPLHAQDLFRMKKGGGGEFESNASHLARVVGRTRLCDGRQHLLTSHVDEAAAARQDAGGVDGLVEDGFDRGGERGVALSPRGRHLYHAGPRHVAAHPEAGTHRRRQRVACDIRHRLVDCEHVVSTRHQAPCSGLRVIGREHKAMCVQGDIDVSGHHTSRAVQHSPRRESCQRDCLVEDHGDWRRRVHVDAAVCRRDRDNARRHPIRHGKHEVQRRARVASRVPRGDGHLDNAARRRIRGNGEAADAGGCRERGRKDLRVEGHHGPTHRALDLGYALGIRGRDAHLQRSAGQYLAPGSRARNRDLRCREIGEGQFQGRRRARIAVPVARAGRNEKC